MKSKILKVVSIITIVPFAIQFIIKQRKKSILRKKVLADGTNDYEGTAKNIANSISKSRSLYKELITKVHPNNFNDDRIELATELSSKITKAKRNYEELIKLKIEVEEFINTKTD
ncbi:hypothetical protein [Flavobacterium sp.]|uniref:hypothetical protein n=1 Tax=Flavobacterium sp. TaxID=239 RepID=UPI0040486460